MKPDEFAVPHTLARLTPLLPAPPARILEAGCGRGALAAGLGALGYGVTGVDRQAEMADAARGRGVTVVEADLQDVAGEYDVVLFTRSLHHAENLDDILAHASRLLTAGGRIIIEEFAWEQVDRTAADFLYDNRSMLIATGMLIADQPSGDHLEAWIAAHRNLHAGSAMLAALRRIGTVDEPVATSMLWRLVDGRGGSWAEPRTRMSAALQSMRDSEERQISTGTLPAVGFLAACAPFLNQS